MPRSVAHPRLPGRLFVVAVAALWLSHLAASRLQNRWAAGTRAMCDGLPAYRALAVHLDPAGERLFFASDRPEPEASERFFCAQYALAPSLLERRTLDALGAPSSSGLALLDGGDVAAGASPAVRTILRSVARIDGADLVRLGDD